MKSHGGAKDLLDWWGDVELPSLDQLLSEKDFPMARPSNDGVSRAQSSNAQATGQQSTQTAVATPYAQGDSDGNLKFLTAVNLKCEKTIYMLKKADAIRCEGRANCQTWKALGSQKFKATSEPFSVLRIGRYEVQSRYSSQLIAKWYYTKKRLNWEILENGLRKKIEISWSDISAIRVEYGGDVEILEIELYKPPHFYCETEVRPKKHTSWKPSSDFSHGQARTSRRHHLEFPQGTLERNMEPLFFLDSRLRELTRRPFPSSESPFFLDYVTDAPQSAPPLINSELIQLHHYLHRQLPPNHSSVPTSLVDDELMILIQEYKRRSPQAPPPLINPQLLQHHQMLALENSLASQVSDYGYAPPPSMPRDRMIFTGQYMGHLPGEQSIMPSSYNSCQVIGATSHGREGYDHNSSPNPMNFAHPWNNQGIFNQDMGHHPGFASSSNAMGMDVHSGSSYHPVTYCNHQSGQEGLIYPDLGSNQDRNHQDDQYMVDYNTVNSLPNEHMNGDDEVRMGNCFWGDKPPHFMP